MDDTTKKKKRYDLNIFIKFMSNETFIIQHHLETKLQSKCNYIQPNSVATLGVANSAKNEKSERVN